MANLMNLLTVPLQVVWDPDPELFSIFGIPLRYYGLLWGIGLFFAYIVVHYQFKDKKIPENKFEPLVFYCFFGILIGARLGHVLFISRNFLFRALWKFFYLLELMLTEVGTLKVI